MEDMIPLQILKVFERAKVKRNMGNVCSNSFILWLPLFSEGEHCEAPQTKNGKWDGLL